MKRKEAFAFLRDWARSVATRHGQQFYVEPVEPEKGVDWNVKKIIEPSTIWINAVLRWAERNGSVTVDVIPTEWWPRVGWSIPKGKPKRWDITYVNGEWEIDSKIKESISAELMKAAREAGGHYWRGFGWDDPYENISFETHDKAHEFWQAQNGKDPEYHLFEPQKRFNDKTVTVFKQTKRAKGESATKDPIEQAIDMVLREGSSSLQTLKSALPRIAKIVPYSKWDDSIEELFKEEGLPAKKEGGFLKLFKDSYLGYVSVQGIKFKVSINWIPLFRAHSWKEFVGLAEPRKLYAVPCDDYDEQEDVADAIEVMSTAGFEVGDFEGF